MAQITSLAKVLSGLVRNYDFTADELVFGSVRFGGLAGTELTKTILDSLIANSHASGSDNQNVVAGSGLTGGGSGATVTLDVGAGSGITVNANDIAVDSTVIRASGANAFTADQSMGGFKLTNVATPVSGTDAANKNYVDSSIQGLDIKQSVRAATTANITLSGAQTIDGVSIIAGDRVLVKNQTTGSENGIYVAAAGAWSRSSDADVSAEVTAGMFTFVEEGTASADSGWTLITDNPITLGTTSLSFSQFSGAGSITAGAGLLKTGNTIDVQTADDSITVNADSIQVKRDAAGALGLTASGVKANVDGSTIEIATNALQLKALGITNAHVSATAAIAYSKLSLSNSIVDADINSAAAIAYSKLSLSGSIVNADISASAAIAYSKLSLSNSIVNADINASAAIAYSKLSLSNSIQLADMTADSVDENKIKSTSHDASLSGGSGSVLSVVSSPSGKKTMVAGEAFAANTSFLVRFAVSGETAGRVYKATSASAVADGKFWSIGVAIGTGQVAGNNIDVILLGSHTLGSSDTAFGAGDIGKALWLTTAGGFSVTAPSASGDAAFRVGSVEITTKMFIDGKQLTGIS